MTPKFFQKVFLAISLFTGLLGGEIGNAASFQFGGLRFDSVVVTSGATTTTLTKSDAQVRTVTGSSTDTEKLPDATTLQAGYWFKFVNQSTGSLTVQNSSAFTLATVASGNSATLYVTSSSTTGGPWSVDGGIAPTNPIVGTQTVGDNSTKAASTAFVQSALNQLLPSVSVYAASTANIAGTYANAVGGVCIGDTFTVTATGALSLDSATPPAGQVVLLKNQTSGFQNGRWTVTVAGSLGVSPVLTRALDWDSSADMNSGAGIFVVNGGQANTLWFQKAIINTCSSDSQVFTQFSGSGGGSVCSALTKTADYSVQTSDFNGNGCLMIRAECSALCTMTAPSASASGRQLKVKRTSTGEVDIAATVDGDSTGVKIQAQYTGVEIDDIGGSEWSLF